MIGDRLVYIVIRMEAIQVTRHCAVTVTVTGIVGVSDFDDDPPTDSRFHAHEAIL